MPLVFPPSAVTAFSNANLDRLGEILVGNGFNISVNLTIEHINNAGSVNGKGRIMSNHNDSVALFVDSFELLHNDVGGARIKVASRFVG